MKIELNRKYSSGLIAKTDLHAGGLFFCILYKNSLEFFANGKVEFSKHVVDAFRPMDEIDISHLQNYKVIGTYSSNERGYIICEFEDLFLVYTGMPTEKDESIIPFHIHDSRSSRKWSEVYKFDSI